MNVPPPTDPTWLDLYDYRQRVARLYASRAEALRAGEDAARVLERFRKSKDALFAHHPQSPFDARRRATFSGLRYFPYDPQWRVEARVVVARASADAQQVGSASGTLHAPLRRAASVHFTLEGQLQTLPIYWIDVYGGGLFLPFRDASCPEESYGGGRYLVDTVKGSDFVRLDDDGTILKPSSEADATLLPAYQWRVQLDFNYAYNPSCAYDSRWVCPLAPRDNWLDIAIHAGERRYE